MTTQGQTKFIMFKYMITTYDTYIPNRHEKKSATKTILGFTLSILSAMYYKLAQNVPPYG
jgi:hypothetical protein